MSIITLNNRALKDATAVGSTTKLGDLVFISRTTASSSSSVSITSGIDNTYKEYIFKFNNIHPSSNDTSFGINFSVDGGSNYNVTKTSTFFQAFHGEDGVVGTVAYQTSLDLAQSTSDQIVIGQIGNGNDEAGSGFLHLFAPSDTTFVKHYIVRGSRVGNNYNSDYFIAGYGNTTSAINAVRFAMSSGNIDSGTIDLYGVN